MRLVRVAPRRAAIDKDLELAGDIRPVGRRDRNDTIRPFVLRDEF